MGSVCFVGLLAGLHVYIEIFCPFPSTGSGLVSAGEPSRVSPSPTPAMCSWARGAAPVLRFTSERSVVCSCSTSASCTPGFCTSKLPGRGCCSSSAGRLDPYPSVRLHGERNAAPPPRPLSRSASLINNYRQLKDLFIPKGLPFTFLRGSAQGDTMIIRLTRDPYFTMSL